MRRLPVYLLLDTSGSMRGEPIESVKVGISSMLSYLRQDPSALESVCICIITFDREVKELAPLTPLEEFQLPDFPPPESGPTHTGMALELLVKCVDRDVTRNTDERKGDWKPLLFLMTDGKPSDSKLYKDLVPQVRARDFARIVGCAAGAKAKSEELKELCDEVVSLDTMDSASFSAFFKWVSDSIAAGNVSMGASTQIPLPPPPPEVNSVV